MGITRKLGEYNDYKYGLDDLNHYMSMMGIDSIERYSRRKIQYLIGSIDTGGTQDCESMTQGSNRLERSLSIIIICNISTEVKLLIINKLL